MPGFLVDRVLRDVAAYVDAIERLGFRSYWKTQVRPDVEERTDLPNLVRVAIHEMMHGWVDWSDDPVLSAWVDGLERDPVVRAAFRARSGNYGYNTYAALAEEGLVKALEQLGAEAMGIPEPPGVSRSRHG